jgi:hypothetical protein
MASEQPFPRRAGEHCWLIVGIVIKRGDKQEHHRVHVVLEHGLALWCRRLIVGLRGGDPFPVGANVDEQLEAVALDRGVAKQDEVSERLLGSRRKIPSYLAMSFCIRVCIIFATKVLSLSLGQKCAVLSRHYYSLMGQVTVPILPLTPTMASRSNPTAVARTGSPRLTGRHRTAERTTQSRVASVQWR